MVALGGYQDANANDIHLNPGTFQAYKGIPFHHAAAGNKKGSDVAPFSKHYTADDFMLRLLFSLALFLWQPLQQQQQR